MNIIKSPNLDYGTECEFFAVNNDERKVYNASHLINSFFCITTEFENHLHVSLKPFYDSINTPVLISNPYVALIADGTVFEIVEKTPTFAIHRGRLRVNEYLKYIEKLFKVSTLLTPYLSKEEGWEFVDAGYRFSSQKIMMNAYSNECWVDEKKEDDDKVTFRTAGFHIHIRFKDKDVEDKMFEDYSTEGLFKLKYHEKANKIKSPKLCNQLIIELDSVYREYLNHLPQQLKNKEIQRLERYSTPGNYRIKQHDGGYKTLEYRQFSSAFFTLDRKTQDELFKKFDMTIRNFWIKHQSQ